MTLRFLGTGASGGTPGRGRSRRRESSVLAEDGAALMIDVTRDFSEQATALRRLDAVLLTHAHRDASGGIPRLRDWRRERSGEPIPVYASAETIDVLERRYAHLEHCRFVPVEPGRSRRVAGFGVAALQVPHAREQRHPTFAWRLRAGGASVVYASDIGRLTPELRRFCRSASQLVLDGAMWGRRLFSHLTIDEAVPEVCGWDVGTILLTQIGRTAPPHRRLAREVASLCARARPAYDGMVVEQPR